MLKTDLLQSPLLNIDPDTDLPLLRADLLVEYASVGIGGVRYICPLRSVSVTTSWTLGSHGRYSYSISDKPMMPDPRKLEAVEHSRVTAINEYQFEDFHVFRGDVRILPND